MADKYVLKNGEPKKEQDIEKWARWFSKADRRLKETKVGKSTVTTGFLGINQGDDDSPSLWETRILGGRNDGKTYQHSSQKKALECHEEVVGMIENELAGQL